MNLQIIKNITDKVTKHIISDIINDKKSDLLKENKITYKYLNQEELWKTVFFVKL